MHTHAHAGSSEITVAKRQSGDEGHTNSQASNLGLQGMFKKRIINYEL